MKKLGIIGISGMLILIFFTACIPSRELKETAIVQALGIDQNENGEYELTMQIYAPKGPGANTAIDSSKNNANIISVTGKTISDAINNTAVLQGEKIFTGQNRLLIIGETLAKNGVQELFSYFDRSRLTRQNIEVLVAQGTAKEVIFVNIEQGILAAETIEKIVDNGEKSGYLCRCPYYQFSKDMYLYHGASVVPVIELSEQQRQPAGQSEEGKEEKSSSEENEIESINQVEIKQMAIFREYRLVDLFPPELGKGLAYLNGEAKKSVIVVDTSNGGTASVSLKIYDTWIEPILSQSQIKFRFHMKAEGEIDEMILPQGEKVGYQEIHELEQLCENVVDIQCSTAFARAINQDKSDILYLGNMVMKENMQLWELVGDDFYQNLDQIDFDTQITIDIKRVGMEVNSQ